MGASGSLVWALVWARVLGLGTHSSAHSAPSAREALDPRGPQSRREVLEGPQSARTVTFVLPPAGFDPFRVPGSTPRGSACAPENSWATVLTSPPKSAMKYLVFFRFALIRRWSLETNDVILLTALFLVAVFPFTKCSNSPSPKMSNPGNLSILCVTLD